MPITTSSQEELTRELNKKEVHELEKFILKTVSDKQSALFSDLETIIGFNGPCELVSDGGLMLWPNISKEAATALHNLHNTGKIELYAANPMDYFIAAPFLPKYPVADKLRDYETPHWFPLAIRPVASEGVD